jgi:hypothetical protein
VPYFSRFSGYSPAEFPQLKETIFKDFEINVRNHQEKLENWQQLIEEKMENLDDLPTLINLEDVRAAMESEIFAGIFDTAFETKSHVPYFEAIKILEKNLYRSYNIIVLLYMKSIYSSSGLLK